LSKGEATIIRRISIFPPPAIQFYSFKGLSFLKALFFIHHFMNLKKELLAGIRQHGGWVNAHAHFDRAYSLDENSVKEIYAPLKKKWDIVDTLKRTSSVDDVYHRMASATELMLEQGVQAFGSFVDVDEAIGEKSLLAAEKLRAVYGDRIQMKFINQTLKGVLDKDARYWFDKALEFVDIIGGLPAKDAGREAEHLDLLLSTGKRLNKRVHVHVDQFNTDEESETEMLAHKVIEHGMEGRVTAIHCISVAAHPKAKREQIYALMKQAGLSVISCPVAWIDHPRTERPAPSHNAITPVDEMLEYGILVAIGTDNIMDVYKPFGDGDMWTEVKLLLEACKIYRPEVLSSIASSNGLEVLGLEENFGRRQSGSGLFQSSKLHSIL
jgi:cytosine/adenosine deaminase-related metal-dependent hydrolase